AGDRRGRPGLALGRAGAQRGFGLPGRAQVCFRAGLRAGLPALRLRPAGRCRSRPCLCRRRRQPGQSPGAPRLAELVRAGRAGTRSARAPGPCLPRTRPPAAMTRIPRHRFAAAALVLLLLAGCGAGPDTRPANPAFAPEAMVAAIRAAAGDADGELAVQPLRDTRVEDLRAEAARLEAGGDVAGAARALDQALEVVGNDPALLQERAELAVLQQDFALAGQLAERAYALGAQVGDRKSGV